MNELERKLEAARSLMQEKNLDALLLQKVSSFAWATCGGSSYINVATQFGEASLLITQQERYLLTNKIEAPRLEKEEGLAAQGWKFAVRPWHEPDRQVQEHAGGLRLGADSPYPNSVDLSGDVARMRSKLGPEEHERYRELSRLCAGAMRAAVDQVRPGMSEYQIGGTLANELFSRGVLPVVVLIATDERIHNYRHPLPADKKLDRYAMLVLCGRKWGLVTSMTRLVHFGPVPQELRRKLSAVARVDAEFIAATRPGSTLGQAFERGRQAYEDTGFANEWHLHHQGGAAGYEPREFIGTPTADEPILSGQVYAWNPSITGTKSEDTVLVGAQTNEIMTQMPGWPMLMVEAAGQTWVRPDILEK